MALRPISDVAADLGLTPDLWYPAGRARARILLDALGDGTVAPAAGRYVLVTAVTPTGAGEGKTLTSIALSMGLARRGHRAAAALRQSSIGPTLGLKGGGAGGGAARVEPLEECLLGLGLDLGAIEAANNLLAAAIDNALSRGSSPIDPLAVTWRRVVDVGDRSLRRVVLGLGGRGNGLPREGGFDITAASEVMAVVAISRDLADMRARLGRIVVGFDREGRAVTAESLRVAGAMAALLRDALQPNLMQTSEGTPVLLHGGPFANIAFGNSSVVADRIALPRVDYLVTEAGFGADLGAEKFLHLKCAASGLEPSCAVVVATVRALRHHGEGDDRAALERGAANLRRHVGFLRDRGLPVVVAVNRFPDDPAEELDAIAQVAVEAGASCATHEGFARGGEGALALADAVIAAAAAGPVRIHRLYECTEPVEEKVRRLATEVYGAAEVRWEPAATGALRRFQAAGYGTLPVCVAKTHLSISHDPALRGAPTGFVFPVRDLRLYAGAGYLTLLAGDIVTMPGLPAKPRYESIDVDGSGRIVGLE